jgi:uncharacterized membrane protein
MLNQFTVSLWGDEGFSAILSMKSIPEIIRIISHDTSPPLYNITEHLAFQFFGTSELVIRGLSFFYYLVTIFFVYKIAALLWSRKTGIYAAALTFLNPFFFIYAFEGRMYSIMAMGVAASMYFFLKRKLVGYVVATLIALYSHHFAIFAIFVQGAWFVKEFLFGNKVTAKRMLKGFIIVGLLYLPWIIPLYNQTKMVGGGFWLGRPDLMDLRNLIYDYLAEGIKSRLAESALYIVFVLLLIRDWFKNIEKTIFMLFWFLVPILATWFISQKFQSIFYNRYLLYTIPAAMITLASNKRVPASNIIIGLLLLMFAVTDYGYFNNPTKLPFREFASYVQQNEQPGDYLINWNSSSHHLWESKYYGIPAPIYIPNDNQLPFFVGTALMQPSDIVRGLPENANRIGVITSGPIDEIVLPNYTETDSESFSDLKIVWYQKN